MVRVVSEVGQRAEQVAEDGRTLGRKLSSTVAVVAAVFLLLLVVDMFSGGFGVGLPEIAVLLVVLAGGLARVWWPRRG
jgi:hypothetical protein